MEDCVRRAGSANSYAKGGSSRMGLLRSGLLSVILEGGERYKQKYASSLRSVLYSSVAFENLRLSTQPPNTKNSYSLLFAGGIFLLAESEGFEPPVPLRGTSAFQANPFDRSGNSLFERTKLAINVNLIQEYFVFF